MNNIPLRKPVVITLPTDIVQLVMTNCKDVEPPRTYEAWNALISEIVKEYFN